MAMVYCSHCGIQNRDGSKFCNNCGARLASEIGLRCPMCSTLNQVETVFCSNCGARLVPLVAAPPAEPKTPPAPPIKGLSLPARSVQPPAEPQALQSEAQAEPAVEPEPAVAPPQAIEETPPTEQGDIPDWIAQLRATTRDEPAQEDGIVVEEIPDWLKSASPESAPVVPEPEPTETPLSVLRKIEIPDWLSEKAIPTDESKSSEPSAVAPTPAEDELPDWLKQVSDSFPETPSVPSVSEDELPDWLRPEAPAPAAEEPAIAEGEAESAEGKFPSEPLAEELPATPVVSEQAISLETRAELPTGMDELPDWLRDAVSVEPEQPSPAPVPPTTEPPLEMPLPSELPAWVAALKPKDADAIAPSFAGETAAEPIEPSEIPPWLAEIKPKEAEQVTPTPAQPAQAEPVPGELPAWIAALKPKEAEQVAPTPAQPAQEKPSELPAWVMALKPKELEETPQTTGGDLATWQGTAILSDLPGILPIATAIAQPHPKPQRVVPSERHEGALVFESLLASTAEPTVAETAKPVRQRTMRPLIYLLLLLAVLIPFIVPMDAMVPITQVPTESFYDLVNALPANAPVIVSFDYDPGMAGEMDLQAKAIVRHLVQRRAKIIAVSTLDTGPQMAQRIMTAIEQETGKIKYATDYVIVYLPSHEVSLSQLATGDLPTKDYKNNSVDAFLASVNFKTLRNAALVIEIAGHDDRLKMWMEQVQPRAGVKIAAAVSAAVEPKARAYRGSNQLAALMSGLLGAAQYEALTRQPAQALIAANSQSIAQIALVFIIVLGNIVHLISRLRGQAA